MKFCLNNAKRTAALVVAVGAMASTALLTTTAAASTSPNGGGQGTAPDGAGQLEVCSQGSYDSYVQFPDRNMTTTIVNHGTCHLFSGEGSSNSVEPINVFGIQSPSTFWITSGSYRPSRGGTVITYGSSANAWASTPTV